VRTETGRIAFTLRRVSGVILALYLVSWAVALPGEPTRPFLSDLRAYGTPGLVVELALIAIVAGHALDGIAQVTISYARLSRRHRAFFAAVAISTLLITLLHVPFLFGGP